MKHRQALLSLFLVFMAVAFACLPPALQAALSVGPAGLGPLTFDTAPPASEWATAVFTGDGNTFNAQGQVDAFVAQTNAAGIQWPLPVVSEATPGTFAGGFRYNSLNHYLQSRPTTSGTNAANVLMATLQNNSGADKTGIIISYSFAVYSAASGELPGFYAYYSLTGLPESWVPIPGLSGSEVAGTVSAALDLSATPWTQGSLLYILWVDDNAINISDPGYSIDNFSIIYPGVPPSFTQQPGATNVLQCRAFTLSALANGSPPISYQWFGPAGMIDPVLNPSAATTTLVITNAQDGVQGDYFCRATNSAGTSDSQTATVAYTPDEVGPIPLDAAVGADNQTITVTFNEPIDPSIVDPISISFIPACGGGTISGADGSAMSPDPTTIVFRSIDPLDPASTYTMRIGGDGGSAGIRDACAFNPVIDGTEISLAKEAVFQNGLNGYAGTQDTGLQFATPDTPQGDRTDFINVDLSDGTPAGPAQGLFRFDNIVGSSPGQVPPGATVLGVRLVLNSTAANANGNPVNVYRMLVPWDEATATWNSMVDGVTNDNVEARATPDASYDTALTVPFVITRSDEGLRQTVQAWVNGTNNYGWAILPTGSDGYRIDTSEHVVETNRPLLAVRYQEPSGPIQITAQPASQTVAEGTRVELIVGSTGLSPTYQWYKGVAPINGAVQPTYVIASAVPDDSGDYKVTVSNCIPSGAISDTAHLTVNADLTSPTVVSVNGGFDPTTITVTFSKAVTAATAQDLANYSIAPSLGITTAILTSPTTVTLTTVARTVGTLYTLTIRNIRDTRVSQNLLSPNPTVASVVYQASLLAFTDVWKYEQSGTDLGTAWSAPGYDDSAWPAGAGILGMETSANTLTFMRTIAPPGGTNTVLSLTNPSGGTNVTIYFRTTFNNPIADLSGVCIRLRAYIDDGAVWYLNGNEAGRYNLPTGPIAYGTFALGALTEPNPVPQTTFITTSLNGLVPGLNHFAAEVHQDAMTSSDIDWGAEIIATFGQTLTQARLSIVLNANGTVTLDWTDSGTLQEAADVTGPWLNSGTQTKPQTRAASGAARFFRVWACP